MASATASARVAAFNLSNTAARWNFTVLAETERARAMPVLEVPLATRSSISRSRDVSGRPLRGDGGAGFAADVEGPATEFVTSDFGGAGEKRSLLADSRS